MTPEHEAEARKLLAEIAWTQEWARADWADDYIPVAMDDLEVAAWRAWVNISEHRGIWQLVKVNDMWEVWHHEFDGGEAVAFHQEPKCAVFKAVLELSKEQADERQR